MALSLIRNGYIRDGYLARIVKSAQLTKGEALNQLKALCQQGFLERGVYYEEYRLNPVYVLPLAMYILDCHPEWLQAEVRTMRAINKEEKAFWDICRAVYESDKGTLGQCGSYEWGFVGFEMVRLHTTWSSAIFCFTMTIFHFGVQRYKKNLFHEYLKYGYYPYYLEDEIDYYVAIPVAKRTATRNDDR